MSRKLTPNEKLIAVVAILPVIADLMEDVKIFRMAKKHSNGFALRRWGFRRTNFQPTTKAKSEN